MEADQFITTITDKEGVDYPLHCHFNGSLHNFQVSCGGVIVAEAKCWLLNNGELQLNDLQVVEAASVPWLKLPLLRYLGLVHRHSFRRRGLAAALVAAVVHWGRQQGVVKITGKVVVADLNMFPGLAEMYQRLGFEVTNGSGNTSYCIEMKLWGCCNELGPAVDAAESMSSNPSAFMVRCCVRLQRRRAQLSFQLPERNFSLTNQNARYRSLLPRC